jgi:hypothetical protein
LRGRDVTRESEAERDHAFYAPSSFDHVVKNLGLTPSQYVHSAELKEWVRRNKDQKYLPSQLLDAWGFVVDTAA